MRPSSPRAFTLVELLVVVSVIAMLSSLLMSGVVTVRTMATRASCLNNLRQIAIAYQGYGADFNGQIPAAQRSPLAGGGAPQNGSYSYGAHWNHPSYTPSPVPLTGGLLHFGDYLRGPKPYFCPGRRTDPYSLKANYTTHPIPAWGDNRWSGMGTGGSEAGYVMANGDVFWNRLSWGRWHRLGHTPGGKVLAMDVFWRWLPGQHYGYRSHQHGRGYNLVRFDGSGAFVGDPGDRLEQDYDVWVGNGTPDFNDNTGALSTWSTTQNGMAYVHINLLGWSQSQWQDATPKLW